MYFESEREMGNQERRLWRAMNESEPALETNTRIDCLCPSSAAQTNVYTESVK